MVGCDLGVSAFRRATDLHLNATNYKPPAVAKSSLKKIKIERVKKNLQIADLKVSSRLLRSLNVLRC